jgi:glycyl-tRNA synthetase beta chain
MWFRNLLMPVLLFILALPLAGCVSKRQHDEVLADLQKARLESSERGRRIAALEAEVAKRSTVVGQALKVYGDPETVAAVIEGAIAKAVGEALGGEALALQADQAALLAKADLLTDMVGEFPELQGIMGRYYALHDGLAPEIADAVEDHYKPRFAGDSLPRGKVGTVVALADKLETLVGMFGIGQIPTGDKDPFALRRHALGVIRMLSEGDLDLPLDRLLATATAPFAALDGFKANDAALADFIYDRLASSLKDQGYTAQEVDAVVSQRPQRLGDIAKRLAAVRAFAALPEAAALAAANKRVGNILKKVEGGVAAKVDAAVLKENAEIALNGALQSIKPRADAAFAAGDYTASLQSLAALKAPVDTFFDQVMVNADDPALRANRQGRLATPIVVFADGSTVTGWDDQRARARLREKIAQQIFFPVRER